MHNRLIIANENTNIAYISSSKIEEGFLTSLHSHSNLEILIIYDGKGYIKTTNRKIDLNKNDIVIINPNSTHCEIGEGLSFYALGISNINIYQDNTYTKKIIKRTLSDLDFNNIYHLYKLIYQNASINDIEANEIINSSYNIIYNILARSFKLNKINWENAIESDLVSNIKGIIDNYYSSNINLTDISKRLSQSISNISHIFKKETNMTIMEYKINKQLEESCNLLKISNMSISDIASLVGFNDTSYFCKLFKNKYNKTPKEYRLGIK